MNLKWLAQVSVNKLLEQQVEVHPEVQPEVQAEVQSEEQVVQPEIHEEPVAEDDEPQTTTHQIIVDEKNAALFDHGYDHSKDGKVVFPMPRQKEDQFKCT